MSDKLKTAICFCVGIIFIVVFMSWKRQRNETLDDSKISKISDGLDDFERMERELLKNAPLKEDYISELASQASSTTVEVTKEPPTDPMVQEEVKEEVVTKVETACSDLDYINGKEGCERVENVAPSTKEVVTSIPETKSSAPRPINQVSYSDSPSVHSPQKYELVESPEAQDPLLMWKKINASEPQKLKGRSTIYPGAVIRAGCTVLAQIENEIVAIPNREHKLTLNVRGALPGCKLPENEGLRLVGIAKMTADERYIEARISRCSDRTQDRKTVDCEGKAIIQSITGSELLEGWLYDEFGVGLFWETITAIGMTPAVAKLAETAASAKTIFQAEASSQISATMTDVLNRVSQKLSSTYNGKEIRITPKPQKPIMVRVMFYEDVVL